jgi:hypothetical protein
MSPRPQRTRRVASTSRCRRGRSRGGQLPWSGAGGAVSRSPHRRRRSSRRRRIGRSDLANPSPWERLGDLLTMADPLPLVPPTLRLEWLPRWLPRCRKNDRTPGPDRCRRPVTRGFVVGVRGFEPPASTSRTWRANQAALHPVAAEEPIRRWPVLPRPVRQTRRSRSSRRGHLRGTCRRPSRPAPPAGVGARRAA